MEQEEKNPEDIVAFDVPLFIRLLEFAREDAIDDATLHKVTENIISMCQDGQVLSMDQYDQIVDITPELDTSNMNSIHEYKNNKKMNEINLDRWVKLAGIVENEESTINEDKSSLTIKSIKKVDDTKDAPSIVRNNYK